MALVVRCRVVNALGSGADYHNKALCSVNTSVALPGIPLAFGRSWIDPVGGSKQQPDPDELNRHAGHEHQESCPSGGCGGGSSQNEGSGNSGRTS